MTIFRSDRKRFVENLLLLYTQRTVADVTLGSEWYPIARAQVDEWATLYNLPRATVACIIAAISPQCDWTRNLIIADEVCANSGEFGYTRGALPTNIRKAERVRDDAADTLTTYFPFGPKVNSFAENLKGSDEFVTVDTHCIQAAFADVQVTRTLKWSAYVDLAACYSLAAQHVGLPPATFQAILWHIWKRLYPVANKQTARRQWDVIGDY